MLRLKIGFPILICSVLTALTGRAQAQTDANVIVFMVDGVRWQEFFHGTDPSLTGKPAEILFPNFWRTMAADGLVLGDESSRRPFYVSNFSNTSLPAYRSIFTGIYEFFCWGNNCGSLFHETLPERLVREMKLKRSDVATIASWQRIAEVVERRPGSTFVNAGLAPLVDDDPADEELRALNQGQTENVPLWPIARFDRYTFAHALRYLKKHRPRFLFISLNDSDEWAHLNNYAAYTETLRQYDRWLVELRGVLAGMKGYGENTSLLVLTDHGRGDGENWVTHNPRLPEARFAWLYGYNPRHKIPNAGAGRVYSHIDVRPTVEVMLGLRPHDCMLCGRPIKEIQ